MLEELHVRDLALIEEAWLEFGPGLTVLTGETGAGKTALLGALKLLLGERADSTDVRSGAPETVVEGRFGVAGEDVVVRRRVSADGRSRCVLDGEMATVGLLGERIGPLVDLHGQHEHQALLTPATHVGYLDRWAGSEVGDALTAYREARSRHERARVECEAVKARIAEAERSAGYLRFLADEIAAVDPQPGEDDALEARVPALQHAEKLSEATSVAAEALRGDGGALDRIGAATAALAKVEGIDPSLDSISRRLSELAVLADDAGVAAREYRDVLEHDPAVLERVLGRLAALSGLKKKYGPTLTDVLNARDSAVEALRAADDSTEARETARKELEDARVELVASAKLLAEVRQVAAPGFTAALEAAAHDLAMEGSRFEVSFNDLEFTSWTADGPHRVEFLYAAAPGQPARPLARIASGGEISRVMLALKGVLGSADTVETLVFDEVDAGIGGSTAHAVGRRLADLARTHQVVVVTHLAQVAAYANDHLTVRKALADDVASTTVARVDGTARVAEIARMLSGNDSETSLAHARELLADARREVVAAS
jgi:DNA repair protein RecN (Recombination protein N)